LDLDDLGDIADALGEFKPSKISADDFQAEALEDLVALQMPARSLSIVAHCGGDTVFVVVKPPGILGNSGAHVRTFDNSNAAQAAVGRVSKILRKRRRIVGTFLTAVMPL